MKTSLSNPNVNKRRWSPFVAGLLAILWIACSGVIPAHADRATLDPTRTQVAYPLPAPPTIDGVVDDAEWERAGGFRGNYWFVRPDTNAVDGISGGVQSFGPVPDDLDDLSFVIYAGYDDQNLYVAVRVRDSAISTDTAAAGSMNETTWDDDGVEVFVDGDNANAARWSAANPGGQYVITANNAYRENEAGNPGYGEAAAWYALTATTLTGYEAEFRIAWSILGDPKPGDIIGFSVGVNDDDADAAGASKRQVLWAGEANAPLSYGNLLIGPRAYTAPLAATAPIVDGIINPAEYAGAQKVHLGGAVGLWDIGGGEDIAEASLNYDWWVVHTADAIYAAANVIDDQVINDNPDAQPGSEDGNTWEDDSVEIFFDSDNTKNLNGANVDFEGQYVFGANGARRDNEALNPLFGATDGWFAATSRTATGYQVEFKIPKANLQNPTNDASIGFMIAVNDDNGPGPFVLGDQLLWFGASHRENTYGTLTLGGTSSPPPATAELRIVEIKPDLITGNITLTWEGDGPQFQVEKATNTITGTFLPVSPVQSARVFTDVGALKSAAQSFYRIRQVSTTPTPAACITTPGLNTWVNTPFTNQTGTFEATFDATPSLDAPFDSVMALSAGPKTAFGDFACLVRFNTDGIIDARNGGAYEPLPGVIPYSAGVKYSFRLVVNIPAAMYSIYVTPAGRVEQTVGTNFAFRPTAGVITNLNNWGAIVDITTGTNTVCNFKVVPVVAPAACITTPGLNTWVNTPFTNQTGTFEATFDATPSLDAPFDSVMALSSGPKTAFGDFACLVRFPVTGNIDARNGANYEAANVIPYTAGVKYSFRLVVNIPAATYSIYVTPAGGTEQTVGTDFAFRPTAGTVTNLNNWGAIVDSADAPGTNTVCNFKVVPVVTPAACVTTPAINVWVNTPFTNQTGTFTATFDATPSLDAPFDSVMALSSGPKTAFGDFACLVRFNTDGIIDARDGGAYAPVPGVIPYSAGVKYTFRLVVDIPAATYSIYVTPAGGVEQTVGTNFAFRPTAGTITNLNNWGAIVDITTGTNTVCNFKVVP